MLEKHKGKLATVVDFLDDCRVHGFRPVLFADILQNVCILPPEIEPFEGERNGGDGEYIWPPGKGTVGVKLITNLTEVARITNEMSSYANLPVADENGVVFLPKRD